MKDAVFFFLRIVFYTFVWSQNQDTYENCETGASRYALINERMELRYSDHRVFYPFVIL